MTVETAKAVARAAERGEVEALRALLASGAPADAAPEGSDSALCYAVMYGHLEATRLLLDAGANVNHRGAYGRTPLHYAVCVGAELTELLLARGADLRARNEGDDDVLDEHIGREGAPARVVDRLLAAGFDLSQRPTKYYAGRSHLMWACFCGRTDVVEKLLAAGVDPDETAPDGDNALSKTLSSMKQRRVKKLLSLLVEAGASPALGTRWQGTTLFLEVCRRGDLDAVQALLARGADPNARGAGTALTCAEESGNQALVDLLLERGARPEQPPVPAGVAEASDVAQATAEAHPDDPALRLAWASVLASRGLRAAAASECFAAERLGATVPATLRAETELENPPGTRWRFVAFEPVTEGVAPPRDDARFPGARVSNAARTNDAARASDSARVLPLAIVLGPFCTRCDEAGTTVCSQCDGSGTRPGFFNADHDYDCPPRETCTSCAGLKYVVDGPRFGKGPCAHPGWAQEAKGDGYSLARCTACGLVSISCGGLWSDSRACGVCGRLSCTCRS